MGRKNRNARRIRYHEYAGMDIALPFNVDQQGPVPVIEARKGGPQFLLITWVSAIILAWPGILCLIIEAAIW